MRFVHVVLVALVLAPATMADRQPVLKAGSSSYVGDTKPGQILCQDVFEYGGRWLIVRPSGKLVR
jgi:hypothetical protein